ncbi:MAG: hypothetical protein DRJ51_00455 [Thermoprotei archaeon]|nr:MAG: hypothetical protein DRJ51_00455 [Thermoprotei archaeon]RLE99932.1 MAG: hypothetical protein DRJ59_07580 [Thermoprotei archaeon]
MSGEIKVWRSKIAPTARGAIFRAKRWFYATYYSRAPEEKREISKQNWANLARKLVEETNREGVSDKGARVIIYYRDDEGVFRPLRAEIEVYNLNPIKTLTITMEEGAVPPEAPSEEVEEYEE